MTGENVRQHVELYLAGKLQKAVKSQPLPPDWDSKPVKVSWTHKVHIYIEYHSVCPLVGIGTPPPPEPKGGGTHSPSGEGVRSPNADDWRKSFSLCLVCGRTPKGQI